MAITLLVADDHEVVRSGVKSLVSGTDIKVVAEAATGEAAVRLILKHDSVAADFKNTERIPRVGAYGCKNTARIAGYGRTSWRHPNTAGILDRASMGILKNNYSNQADRNCYGY